MTSKDKRSKSENTHALNDEKEYPHSLNEENKYPQREKEETKFLHIFTEAEQKHGRYKQSTFKHLLTEGNVDIGDGKKRKNKRKEKRAEKEHSLRDTTRGKPASGQNKHSRKTKHIERHRTQLSVQVHIARLSDGKRDGVVDKFNPSEDDTQVSDRNAKPQKKTKYRQKKQHQDDRWKKKHVMCGKDGANELSKPKIKESKQKAASNKPRDDQASAKETKTGAAKKSKEASVDSVQKKKSSSLKKTKEYIQKKEANKSAAQPKRVAKSSRKPESQKSSTSSESGTSYSPDPDWQVPETTASSSSDSGPTANVPVTRGERSEAELAVVDKEVGSVKEPDFDKKEPFPVKYLDDQEDALYTKCKIIKYIDIAVPNGQNEATMGFSFTSTGDQFGQTPSESSPEEAKSASSTSSAASIKEDIVTAEGVSVKKKKSLSGQNFRRARVPNQKATKKRDVFDATKKNSPVGRAKSAAIAASVVQPIKSVGTSKSKVGYKRPTKGAPIVKSRGRKDSPSSERGSKDFHNSPSKSRKRLIASENVATGKQKDGVKHSIRRSGRIKQHIKVRSKPSDDDDVGMIPIDCPVVTDIAMRKTSKVTFKLQAGAQPYESDLSTSSDRAVMSEQYEASSSVTSSINSEITVYHGGGGSTYNIGQAIHDNNRSQSYDESDCSIGRHDSFYDSDPSSCTSGRDQSDGYSDCSTCSYRNNRRAYQGSEGIACTGRYDRSGYNSDWSNGRYDQSAYNSDGSSCKSSRSLPSSNQSYGPYNGQPQRSPSLDPANSLSAIPRSQPFIVPTQLVKKASSSTNKRSPPPNRASTSRAKSSGSLPQTDKYAARSYTPSSQGFHSARSRNLQDTTKRSYTTLPLCKPAEFSKVDLSKVPSRLMMYAVPVSSHPKSEAQLMNHLREKASCTSTGTHTRSRIRKVPEPPHMPKPKSTQRFVYNARDTALTKPVTSKDTNAAVPKVVKTEIEKKVQPSLRNARSEEAGLLKKETTKKAAALRVGARARNGVKYIAFKRKDTTVVKRVPVVRDKNIQGTASKTYGDLGPKVKVSDQKAKGQTDGEKKLVSYGQKAAGLIKGLTATTRTTSTTS